ncbi:helix-turn-helix domain-containing protein [Lusitaniella coriacea LEGE 07157]|uniref:Helix-turn-helix domain-containing protein n=1 Tax=Lusitaniella coriacea LEGE 07157 TaxID=945747 RepID=A0A8J7DYW7_9CYAN|nr:helix-turn-helix transcriptional regulator [Lusitaniella coriacea]MBE9117725.1 helix-turn-helix domain-containing protein [Lusitaniella coriacea LEGE 07157]
MSQTFGQLIRKARKEKGYSQRELAKLLELDFTYLSKIENDRADYAPKEEAIRAIARHLNLDPEELIFLVGRIPHQEEALLKQHYKAMPTLFRRLRENPEFAQKVFREALEEDAEAEL